jgi:hypothetical protein
VALCVIYNLRHRYKNFPAKKANSLKMLFDLSLF